LGGGTVDGSVGHFDFRLLDLSISTEDLDDEEQLSYLEMMKGRLNVRKMMLVKELQTSVIGCCLVPLEMEKLKVVEEELWKGKLGAR